jgi:CubicO group peptidase (beta-lactamase class C family)
VKWILGIACSLVAALAGAQSDNVAKAKAFVDAMNTQDQAKMEAFVSSAYSPKVGGNQPLSQRAATLLSLSKRIGPLTLGDVISEKPNELVVHLKGRLELGLEMKMGFDPEDRGIAFVLIGGPGSQSGPSPKHYTGWKDLSDLLGRVKEDNKLPAIGLAAIKDGISDSAVVGEREIGKSDKALLTGRWLIGSITKSMTSTMIARLIDQGKLRWDTTVEQALPKLPMKDEYRKVTLLQLLHHRSGLPQDLFADLVFIAKASGGAKKPVEIRDNYARFILSREPIDKPDNKMAYSNAGYALAAHMAETVAGKPYEQLMKELVFDPLGMSTAIVGVPGAPDNPGAAGQINGHVPDAGSLKPHVLREPELSAMFAPAGGGVSMSVGDLLKFAAYNLEGLRGHVTLMSPANFEVLHKPIGDEQYGCGWMVSSQFSRDPYHGHNGSDGTFRAEMAIWPEKNIAVVAIMNAGSITEPSPALQAVIAVYDRFLSPLSPVIVRGEGAGG